MGPAFNRQQRLMAPTTKEAPMPVVLAVALGGAAGSVARYGLDRLIERRSFAVFPWSTFTINATGCLLIGFVIATLVDRHHAPAWLRVGLVMGVLGGYTTFSTFAQETLDLIEEGRLEMGALYAFASLTVGVLAVLTGMRLGRML
jgi:CrcB protein